MKKGILTEREQEVFDLLVLNKSTKEIAIQKLGVKGRAQAVVELIKMGELTI